MHTQNDKKKQNFEATLFLGFLGIVSENLFLRYLQGKGQERQKAILSSFPTVLENSKKRQIKNKKMETNSLHKYFPEMLNEKLHKFFT